MPIGESSYNLRSSSAKSAANLTQEKAKPTTSKTSGTDSARHSTAPTGNPTQSSPSSSPRHSTSMNTNAGSSSTHVTAEPANAQAPSPGSTPSGLTFSMAPNYQEYNDSYGLPWFNHCFVQDFIPSQPEIKSRLETGIRMLDVGCGCGAGVKNLAQHFPNSHFFGLDIDQSNVDLAIKEVAPLGLQNLTYVCADATAMPEDWTSTFDYVFFFNVLHDTPRPDVIIDEVKRVMKKGGIMSVIEVDGESKVADNLGNPAASFVYTDSLFYCLPMSYNFPDSLALGAMWGKGRIKEFLQGKGLTVKAVSQLPMMPQVHFLCELK